MKFFTTLCLIGLLAFAMGVQSPARNTAYAQAPQPAATPLPTPLPRPSANAITLGQMRINDRTLRGPIAATTYEIALPPDWQLRGAGTLFLSLSTALPADTQTLSNTNGTRPPARLHIGLNGVGLPDIVLDQADSRIIPIALPTEALLPHQPQERLSLSLQLDDQSNCTANDHVQLFIHNNTALDLPHDEDTAAPSLRYLPWPLYQESLVADAATVLIPDQPTPANLQAAFTVMAGLGRMTSGKLGLTLTTVSQINQSQWSDSHIIFVGAPAQFGMLRDLVLPLAPNGNGNTFEGISSSDGVLQLARSPWGKGRVALLVSGNSDEATLKAARALSQGDVSPADTPNLALVAQVQTNTRLTLPERFTLADLGYENQEFEGSGNKTQVFTFDVPSNKATNDQAYIDLDYVHSPLLDYGASGIAVALNGQSIGAVRFDDNSTQLSTARVTLPKTAVRPGRNELRMSVDLRPREVCALNVRLWASIRPETRLNVPLVDAPNDPLPRRLALTTYPRLLLNQPALSSVAFVLAPNQPQTWAAAAQIATDLGRRNIDEVLDLAVAYSDAVPDALRENRHLIIVGQPIHLPILNDLSKTMPAPFEANTNTPDAGKANVQYEFPKGNDIGYLELMSTPWSERWAALAVLGNSDTGVQEAAAALLSADFRAKMTGNLTVINQGQLDSSDVTLQSNTLRAVDPSSAGDNTNTPAVAIAANPNTVDAPTWLIPAVLGSVGLLLLILAITLFLTRKRRSSPVLELEDEE